MTSPAVISPQVADPGTNSGSTIDGNQADPTSDRVENESATIDVSKHEAISGDPYPKQHQRLSIALQLQTDQLSRINQILLEGFAGLNARPSTASLLSPLDQTNQTLRAILCEANSQKDGLKTFFTNVGAISTLGSSITFALIVSQLQDPSEVSKTCHFDLSTVRIFISISWLLFTIALVSSIFLAVLDENDFLSYGSLQQKLAVFLMYLLEIAAFTLLALTVAAYVDVVGFLLLALVFGMLLIIALVGCWIGMSLKSRIGNAIEMALNSLFGSYQMQRPSEF